MPERSVTPDYNAPAATREELEAEVERLREAMASAATSLATGPLKDGYAYRILTEALDG